MDRVKTGVAGLDTMLSGGLLPARPYVVSGPTGGGKTILSAHFLLEGLHAQEPCLLVTLDEPPIEVKSNVAVFGWNMDRLKILDATPDVRAHKRTRSVIDVGTSLDVRDMEQVTDIRQSSQVRALEVTVHSVQKMIKQEFAQHLERTKQRYKRIVIDSMTALKMFSMHGEDSRILIQSFLRFLSELEATTLIVSEHLDRTVLETEFFLSRGEIRLHKWLDGSFIRRAVSVEKFRGSSFDDRMRPVRSRSSGARRSTTGCGRSPSPTREWSCPSIRRLSPASRRPVRNPANRCSRRASSRKSRTPLNPSCGESRKRTADRSRSGISRSPSRARCSHSSGATTRRR